MLNDLDIDMEELEARLYGQVHYGNYDEDTSSKANKEHFPTINFQQPRYFTNIPHVFTTYGPYPHPSLMSSNLFNPIGLPLNPAAFNNIVVVQQPPTQIFNNNGNYESSKLPRLSKSQRRKARRHNFSKPIFHRGRFKEHHLSKHNVTEECRADGSQNQVVNLNSSCKIIEPKVNVVIVSSDDECIDIKNEQACKNTNTESVEVLDEAEDGDEVIFVETKTEIINIDCDDELKVTNSVSPTVVSIEQNDFLEDTILVSSPMLVEDIDLVKAADVHQPNLNADISDSETSCNTSDTHNPIFKETAFETTNKHVSSLTIDDFENYILASGNFDSGLSVTKHSNPCHSVNDVNKQSIDKNNRNSSDSSSESDYDDLNATILNLQPNNTLPNLSLIDSDNEVTITACDDIKVEMDSRKRKIVEGDLKTSMTDTSVVCISSSDELSDVDDVENSVELLNIEGTIAPPKEQVSNLDGDKYKPSRFSDFYSDDMKKFYNESWGQENFDYRKEQLKMSDDPKMWKILDQDSTHIFGTPRGPRCRRCRQFGHKVLHCTNKSAGAKCILCGFSGHYESKCPNKLCCSCGTRIPFWTTFCHGCTNLRYTVCKICSIRGHTDTHCPDLWRRYHLTVSEGPPIRPETNTYKLPQDRWCCGCASQGHYEHECKYVFSTCQQTGPFVYSYNDVYGYCDGHQNQDFQNNDQTKIPNLLDLQVSLPNKLVGRTKLILAVSGAERLLNCAGVEFLKDISIDTDLQIKVIKPRRDHGQNKYICIIEGSEQYKSEAISKIHELCRSPIGGSTLFGMFTTKKFCRRRLRLNLFGLNKEVHWTQLVKNTYNKILVYEKQIRKGPSRRSLIKINRRLSSNYMALNAVLICKFKIGDQQCIALLKEWHESKTSFVTDAIKQAYKYVFLNDGGTDIDYKRVIANLPCDVDRPFYTMQRSLSAIMKRNKKMCRRLNLKNELELLENYYQLLESDYGTRHIKDFMKFCKTLNQKNLK